MIARWVWAAALTVALTGCQLPPAGQPSESDQGASGTPGPMEAGPAGAALAGLAVKGRAPRTGYDRDAFGQAWADVDRNGCDTRNDILARDLTAVAFRPGTSDCVVVAGTLDDPYTGRAITFSKADADAVQIDHVVALSDAWQKGAQQWTVDRRRAFANDPLNLLAVDGPANGRKSDGDAATWLPPNGSYRCPLVARQIAVKVRYELSVTPAERDAMARVLAACPREPLPDAAAAPTADPPDAPAVEAPGPPLPSNGQDIDYGSCREALLSGAGPYVRGTDLEYDFYRDADGDGVVCE